MTKTKTTFLFLGAIIMQLAILALIPAKQIYARMTGRLITIKTAPIDPYNILSGYYVTLSYQISRPSQDISMRDMPKVPVYVVLKEDPNKVWVIDSVNKQPPSSVGPDKVLIRGKASYRGIEYGIESYFIPEDKRQSIEHDLRDNRNKTYAQIKVDRFGNAALVRLLIGDTTYEY
jgi:uncharacterized membrane-anchored protein